MQSAFTPKELEWWERQTVALENIAVNTQTISAYLQMITEGKLNYAAPNRKKAPSLAKRHAKRR